MVDETIFSDLLSTTAIDDDVLAVLLFGSYNRGEPFKDIDVALVMDPSAGTSPARKLKQYMRFFDDFDLHVFQDLPLYVRATVMRECTILQEKDKDKLFDTFWSTIKEWNLFKPRYETFLDAVKDG